MPNTQEVCNNFKKELLEGHHALGTCIETRTASTKDEIKAALYFTSSTINKSTAVYTTVGEINDASYAAGGQVVTFGDEPALDGDTAHITPSTSVTFSTLTEELFNCALFYNNEFTTKRSIAAFVFTEQNVTAGDFVLTMPTGDGTTGLIRLP